MSPAGAFRRLPCPGMARLAILQDTLADENGDGIDDDTGEPVPVDDTTEPDDTPTEDDTPDGTAAGRHEWILVVEGVETGDGRIIVEGGLTWRDLPLPFMATDKTGPGHDGAQLVANIVEIERRGNAVYGITQNVDSDDPDVLRLQKLIDRGELTGVSVDMDRPDATLEIVLAPDDGEGDGVPSGRVDDDGNEIIEVDMEEPTMRINSARIMGATAVPFPAFAEAQLVASVLNDGIIQIMTAQGEVEPFPITIPTAPPADWFTDPGLSGPTPLTVTDDGRLYGHAALWNTCHRAFKTCTPPPRAPGGDYSHFHTGTIVCAGGERVSVGNLTVDSGHAEIDGVSALGAIQHYDNSGWCGAEIVVGEDEHGIWMSGSLRPNLTPQAIRAVLACDVSGDWRSLDGRLRLIGLASVPVPGFVKTHVTASGHVDALVASVPICADDDPDLDTEWAAMAEFIATSIGRDRATRLGQRDALAIQIGRHPAQRATAIRDELAASIAAEVR